MASTSMNPNAAHIKEYASAAGIGAAATLLNSFAPLAGVVAGLAAHTVFANAGDKINELVDRVNITNERVDAAAKFAARFFAAVATATLVTGFLGMGFGIGNAAFSLLAVEALPSFYQNVTDYSLIPA